VPQGAKSTSLEEIMHLLERYKGVFDATGGGITLTGGEVLSQNIFAGQILAAAKQLGIHTCIDTSGHLVQNLNDQILNNLDLVLLDIKSGDQALYEKVTKTGILENTISFAKRLIERKITIRVRFVLVPGLTDSQENIANMKSILEDLGYYNGTSTIEHVDILPFHQLGTSKWHELGLNYELENAQTPSNEQVQIISDALNPF
jgi:pyruvate formate lyase activating enzyme